MDYDALIAPDPEEWLEMDEEDRAFEIRHYHKNLEMDLSQLTLHASFHLIVENQIAENYEPTVKAMSRLMKEGLDRHDAIHAVGSVVSKQIFNCLKYDKQPDPKVLERKLDTLTAAKWIEEFSDVDEPKPQKRIPENRPIPQVTLKQVTIVGMAWWKPEQWDELKRMIADPEYLPKTYVEWKRNAKRILKGRKEDGVTIQKIEIDLQELQAWCQKESRPIDSSARAAFVTHKLNEKKPILEADKDVPCGLLAEPVEKPED